MFKIIFSIFIFSSLLFSSQIAISTKIVGKIITAISPNAQIWIDDKEAYIDIIDIEKIKTVINCNNADILITKNNTYLKDICQDKPVIVFDYDLLYSNKNSVAAFFWKKGRPNIVFIKERLGKFNIIIPTKYNSYLIDKP